MEATDLDQQILEDWARLEREFEVPRGTPSSVVIRRMAMVVEWPPDDLVRIKRVRDACAHGGVAKLSRDDLDSTAHAVRQALGLLMGMPTLQSRQEADARQWSVEGRCERGPRRALLDLFNELFGDARQHRDIEGFLRSTVRPDEFKQLRDTRDQASHPCPPPLASDVSRALRDLRRIAHSLDKEKRRLERAAHDAAEAERQKDQERREREERDKDRLAAAAAERMRQQTEKLLKEAEAARRADSEAFESMKTFVYSKDQTGMLWSFMTIESPPCRYCGERLRFRQLKTWQRPVAQGMMKYRGCQNCNRVAYVTTFPEFEGVPGADVVTKKLDALANDLVDRLIGGPGRGVQLGVDAAWLGDLPRNAPSASVAESRRVVIAGQWLSVIAGVQPSAVIRAIELALHDSQRY